jgi:hypothetical protein
MNQNDNNNTKDNNNKNKKISIIELKKIKIYKYQSIDTNRDNIKELKIFPINNNQDLSSKK